MIELSPEVMELAKKSRNREELKKVLQGHQIESTDPEINELAWELDIPHGANCPCCMAMFYPMRMRNMGRVRRDSQ